MRLKMDTNRHVQVGGPQGDQTAVIDVDNDEWYEFNKEYYKLRELEYYAMYKIPEFVKLRSLVSDLRHTTEMGAILTTWGKVTHQEEHQLVVKRQAEMIMAAVKCIHMTEADKQWLNPTKSPVMFETWHAVYLYFVAVGKGDLNPLLDFVIDGKYDENFVEHVKPDFGRPDENNLYLY